MTTDTEILEINIRNLERENRELRTTLRDTFAASVAPALIGGLTAIEVAKSAYRVADAMLEARSK